MLSSIYSPFQFILNSKMIKNDRFFLWKSYFSLKFPNEPFWNLIIVFSAIFDWKSQLLPKKRPNNDYQRKKNISLIPSPKKILNFHVVYVGLKRYQTTPVVYIPVPCHKFRQTTICDATMLHVLRKRVILAQKNKQTCIPLLCLGRGSLMSSRIKTKM